MPTAESKRRWANVGIFLMPLLMVKAAGLMLASTTPRGADAASDPAEAPPVAQATVPAPTWSEAQRAAAAHVRLLAGRPMGQVPLYYEPNEPEPAEVVVIDLPPELQPPPEVVLQAILSSANSDTALIGGKAHQVGDQIGESGWFIIAIDPDLRSVTIRDPQTDRVETITVHRPG